MEVLLLGLPPEHFGVELSFCQCLPGGKYFTLPAPEVGYRSLIEYNNSIV